jgi:hypothetical protein
MKSTFDSMDTDLSGFIDMDELVNVAKALGHTLQEEELKVVFDELDENQDHKISYEEFTKWWKKGRAGKGNAMRNIVGLQAKAKRLLDGAHEEIKEISSVTVVPADQVINVDVNIKVGGPVDPATAPLGVFVKASCGNNTERDTISAAGGLDETQKGIFSRLSLKIADGKDPEDARDRLSTIVTKITSFIASQNHRADRILSKLEFKFRIRDGHVDVYVIVDETARHIEQFLSEVWVHISSLFNESIEQEVSGGIRFSNGLADIVNNKSELVIQPLLGSINITGKVSFWSKLMEIGLKIAEMEHDKKIVPFFLFNGGSLNFNYGSYQELPAEIKDFVKEMCVSQ